MDSEYPEVNGALSQTCYLKALDDCYTRFIKKQEIFYNKKSLSCESYDYFLFHSPYNKLVQKSFGRLMYLDILSSKLDKYSANDFAEWKTPAETYENKNLETKLKGIYIYIYIYIYIFTY